MNTEIDKHSSLHSIVVFFEVHILEGGFLSRPFSIPTLPINPRQVDDFFIRHSLVICVAATIMALVTFYGPELVAYQSHFNDPEIHSALRLGWTMFNVWLFAIATFITYWFAASRARLDRKLATQFLRLFPDMSPPADELLNQHRGILRFALLSLTVSGAIVLGAGLVQGSTMWWQVPLLHAPLGVLHLTTVFFVAGYFLLRSLAVNKVFTLALETSDPPPIPWQRLADRDIYSQIGTHYILLSAFGMFAALYLTLAWIGIQSESGGLRPEFNYAASLIWSVIPGYIFLVLGLVFAPIFLQHKLLSKKNHDRINPLAVEINRLIHERDYYHSTSMDRLTTYKFVFDTLSSSYPDWPVHPRQIKVIIATTTGLLFPLIGNLMRTIL